MRKLIMIFAAVALMMPMAYQASADEHMENENNQQYNQRRGYPQGMRGYGPGDGRYHMGPGMMGRGYGPGNGYHMGPRYRDYGTRMGPAPGVDRDRLYWHDWTEHQKDLPEGTALSKQDARAAVENFLNNNYKGYSVQGEIIGFDRPRGQVFQVPVRDESGNKFIFMVNPWGQVRGPILVK